MKNFFENNLNKDKNNPFINKKVNGDIKDNMDNKDEKIQESEQSIIEDGKEAEEQKKDTDTQESDNVSEENKPDELEELKGKYNTLNNQYLRLAADFDNYRKRQAQEREALLKYGAEECMKKVIEVVDNFDRAIKTVETIDNIEKMKETFFILNKQLNDSLSKLGLEQIKSIGEKFDPNLHEAVMQTQSDDKEEETILEELQKGYKLGDKVLRPAMVSVAVK